MNNYKIRKMTVWQRLYVMDLLVKFKDSPFTVLALILKHGIESWEGLNLKETEMELAGNKKCKVLTDESLDLLLSQKGDINEWNDIVNKIFEENAFPFTKDTIDGEQK